MAINLQKGQTIDLAKSQYDLSSVTVGLGWDVRKPKPAGLLGKLFAPPKEEDYDLDAIAFLLNDQSKVGNLGNKLIDGDVVFFNSQKHPSGHIWLTGDNRTGAGEGDDEQIIVRLNDMSPAVQKILFLVTIYQAKEKGQHFGMIENAYIRAVDARGAEMARYSLSTDDTFKNKCSMSFAELYRRDGGWKFRAIGEAEDTDAFVDILKRYV